MELSIQELEDIAAARLVRNQLEVSFVPAENLVAAIGAQLLRQELPTAEVERKYIEQSVMNMIGNKTVEFMGEVA